MSKGLTINVGKVINKEMKAMMHPKKMTQAIGFPSLISTLCMRVGLRFNFDLAEWISLIADLVWKIFNKQIPTQGGASSSSCPQAAEWADYD